MHPITFIGMLLAFGMCYAYGHMKGFKEGRLKTFDLIKKTIENHPDWNADQVHNYEWFIWTGQMRRQ